MSDNSVIMVQVLEFGALFPNEKPLTPKEYLKGGGKDVILKVASLFLSFKSQNSKYADNDLFLHLLFGNENKEFAIKISKRIKNIENERNGKIIILNHFSTLMLFEEFYSTEEQAETQSHAEFEVNLFKAYLVLNSRFTQMQNTAISSTEHLEEEFRIPMMMFCTDYPISDKIHFNIDRIWVVQIIKAIYLFQFLESNEQTRPLLNEYIKYFEKDSWQDYLRALISLTISVIKKDEETYTDIVVNEENFEKDCAFIEKFIVLPNEELDEYDFLSLRSKPFYKVENGKYRVIFDLFVAEKIFKGVYFILREINKIIDEKNQISEIKSFLGKEFSEKVLAYKVIEKIFKGKCVKYSGQEMDDLGVSGAPDYYIRIGKNILVFESKDFLIGKDKKTSFNFDVYLEEFERVLYFENTKKKVKHKAVKQLISNIELLLKLDFIDNDYKYKDVNIYPILLTHDQQYDTFGFNRLIDDWFQNELDVLQENGFFIYKVKPLTVINVDTLIFHEIGLANEISLHRLIDEYIKQTNIKKTPHKKFSDGNQAHEFYMSKHISFATFADNYFNKRKLTKIPSVLESVKDALFDKERDFFNIAAKTLLNETVCINRT